MFWKKKSKIDIEFDDDGDHRQAFRIRPEQTRPILLNMANNSFPLINVSGTGCCFRSHSYSEGMVGSGTLKIPSDDLIFPVTVKVVKKQRDLCRCEFTKISESSQDAIHSYILEAQKKQIRG